MTIEQLKENIIKLGDSCGKYSRLRDEILSDEEYFNKMYNDFSAKYPEGSVVDFIMFYESDEDNDYGRKCLV